MRMIRAVSLAVVCSVGLWWMPPVYADAATASRHPVSWELPELAPCTQLPDGLTVDGSGMQHVVVQVRGGVEYVDSTATGTATDSDGNSYQWVYDNRLQFDLATGEGHFIDRFDLNGTGGARGYKVYLDWNVTIDVSVLGTVPPDELVFFATAFDPIVTNGDPNCDPI